MKNGWFPKILPHLVAIIVFLIVAMLYCKPALEGMVVTQSDITQWRGSIQQSMEYKEVHGHYPLWTNALFSGMPAFYIGYDANNLVPWLVHGLLSLHLPIPIQFFFLACICFYFLCIVLRVNPYIGIFGALSFAYATYNPVIISVGHDTKMWSIAYMPALLGSILLIYDRKYWVGAALTALFTSVMIAMNHPQIAYYFFLAAGVMTIFFIARWAKQKEYMHLAKALGFTLVAGVIGLLVNAVSILSTYEYQKESIRGGHSDLTANQQGQAKTGLAKDYAFQYSMAIAEPFVMMVPRMFGGSSDKAEKGEDSKALETLRSLPQELQQQLPLSYYWGGIGGTSGPPYVGAVICFLAILGMVVLDGRHKWWIFTAVVLTIMMSWGKFFDSFNAFFYHYFPLYNKFRAPSMILVVPQLLLPVLAVLTVNKFAFADNKAALQPLLKKGLIAAGVVFLVLLGLYASSGFLNENDKTILSQVSGMNQPQLTQAVDSFFDALKEDRKSLMLADIFRSLGFALAALALVYALLKSWLKPLFVFVLFSLLTLIDLLPIDSNYLNSENYVEQTQNESMFQKTAIDEQILADTSYYRVFNLSGIRDNITSYHYNSVGGYHTARLRLYDDLIENQLSKPQLNLPVFNMLNTKYFIQKDGNGLTQRFQKNDSALGPVWLVKAIRFVKNADEEMKALDYFNPSDTAIVQESFKAKTGGASAFAGNGTIKLVKHENDLMQYAFNSTSNEFAVFSEVYYEAGWKAFIDGKEAPIVKVNYVLRGLNIPAGTHTVEFRFAPEGYVLGRKITSIFSIVMGLLFAAAIFLEYKRLRGRNTAL